MKSCRGFTLIELMIVVAIIAVIAAIATSAYQDNVARAQVAEGLGLAAGAKTAVLMYHGQTGQYPSGNAAAGLAQPASISGRYVQSVTVRPTGQIDVSFSGAASTRLAGQSVSLTPMPAGDGVNWTCSGTSDRLLPSSCR